MDRLLADTLDALISEAIHIRPTRNPGEYVDTSSAGQEDGEAHSPEQA
jgi:hypothetical protein